MNRDYLQNVSFILTAGLSLVLSVLLFTSVADNRFSFVILMGIALALELGKLIALNDRYRFLACLLIAVSVFGSMGGLSRAIDVSEQQYSSVETDRLMIMSEIEQNNQAIDRYLVLDRIKVDAQPLQDRNQTLREELKSLPKVEVSELSSLLVTLSTLLALPLDWVNAAVVLILSGILDYLLVCLVRDGVLDGLLGGNDPDRDVVDDEVDTTLVVDDEFKTTRHNPVMSGNVEAMDDSYPAFKKRMLSRREAGLDVLTQRACMRETGLRERLVRQYYLRLVSDRVIEKMNQRYVFVASNMGQVSWL